MGMTPLGDLIQEVRMKFLDKHGVDLSYTAISRRGGEVITRSRVQQLAKDPIREMPSAATLKALALGLGLEDNEALVVERALASAGYGDLDVAARPGTSRQSQIDAAAPDPNVDPPGPEEGA